MEKILGPSLHIHSYEVNCLDILIVRDQFLNVCLLHRETKRNDTNKTPLNRELGENILKLFLGIVWGKIWQNVHSLENMQLVISKAHHLMHSKIWKKLYSSEKALRGA